MYVKIRSSPIYSLIVFATLTSLCFQTSQGKGEKFQVRKCCLENQFYSVITQSCQSGALGTKFQQAIQDLLVNEYITSLSLSFGRIIQCTDVQECPEISIINNPRSHALLRSGHIYEAAYDITYDMENYCLELVGNNIQSTVLAIAFCLPESSAIPKCCPKDEYFDTLKLKCSPHSTNADSEKLIHASLLAETDYHLDHFNELQCARAFPEQFFSRSDIFVNECRNLCIQSPMHCYSIRKYCIDNTFDGIRLTPSVFVCADNITKKCCRGENIDEEDCSCKTI